jgi:hypothetical protein
MIKLKVKSYKEISNFIRDEKDLFFSTIIECIEEAWKINLNSILVAEFDIVGDIMTIEIEKKDWSESLHVALYYYEDIEKYEKCTKIRNLIDDIYDGISFDR